jgi:hypothetical protein
MPEEEANGSDKLGGVGALSGGRVAYTGSLIGGVIGSLAGIGSASREPAKDRALLTP